MPAVWVVSCGKVRSYADIKPQSCAGCGERVCSVTPPLKRVTCASGYKPYGWNGTVLERQAAWLAAEGDES